MVLSMVLNTSSSTLEIKISKACNLTNRLGGNIAAEPQRNNCHIVAIMEATMKCGMQYCNQWGVLMPHWRTGTNMHRIIQIRKSPQVPNAFTGLNRKFTWHTLNFLTVLPYFVFTNTQKASQEHSENRQ